MQANELIVILLLVNQLILFHSIIPLIIIQIQKYLREIDEMTNLSKNLCLPLPFGQSAAQVFSHT